MEQKKASVNFINVLLILIFLIGMGILLYPNISDYINLRNSSKVIATYDEELAEMEEEQRKEIMSEAVSYNYNLMQDGGRFSMTDEDKEEYMDNLNIDGKGMMGYLKVPKLGINVPIMHTTEESVLQTSVGHVEGTSLPVGGNGTHAALSAHTGLPSAVLFTYLEELEEGDTFTVYILGEAHKYVIDRISVVLPGDTSELAIDPNEDYITLITCTPYGQNTHRLMVRGKRVTDETVIEKEKEDATMEKLTREQIVSFVAGGFGIAFGGLLIFLLPAHIKVSGLRPWDETIDIVTDAAYAIYEESTKENWEVASVSKEAKWLASWRRWDDDILKPWHLEDKEFDKARTLNITLDGIETGENDLEEHDSFVPKHDYSYKLHPELRFSKTKTSLREWDESLEKEKEHNRKKRDWDVDILDKVSQNWKQLDTETYKKATRYTNIDENDGKEEK